MTDLYSEEAYVAAIARRNIAWARFQDALKLLRIYRDELGFTDVHDVIRQVNETQHDYEHAARDLVRARVIFRSAVLYADEAA